MIAFVSDRGGAYQIWIAPFANGRRVGEPRRITADRGTASYPTWAPDGKTIAYIVVTDEGKEVWLAPADGSGRSRRLTSGAQAGCLRWSGTSRQIVVLGLWGQQLPTLRSVSPETGELRPFPLPGTITLNPDVVDFDLSPDGRLLAFFEGRTESVVWLREAEKGSF
jgi:Tol biopolymer transport system component